MECSSCVACEATEPATAVAEATELADLLRRHGRLMRTWLTDFCTEDIWHNLLPDTWQAALLALSDEELQRLPTDYEPPAGWPDDLRHLILSARRTPPPDAVDDPELATGAKVNGWLFRNLPHCSNMGPKKEHEVRRLAPLVARVAGRCGARIVVDVGSGHGYLSHVLAFHHGLHVVGIEASAANVAAAHHRAWVVREKLRDPRFKAWESLKAKAAAALADEGADGSACRPERAAGEPSPLVAHGGGSFSSMALIMPAAASMRWLDRALQPAVQRILDADAAAGPAAADAAGTDAADEPRGRARYVLVGLHTCGDLAPTLLRLAATATPGQSGRHAASGDDSAAGRSLCAGVVSLGCCYHRVSECAAGGGPEAVEAGAEDGGPNASDGAADEACEAWRGVGTVPSGAEAFSNLPMSAHCRSLGVSLGEIALKLSLQPVWRWPHPLTPLGETARRCRHHLFRCVLECRLRELRAAGETEGAGAARGDGMKLPRDGNVGPIPPCDTFERYAQLAFERLGLRFDDDEASALDALWRRHAHLERPLRCFVMLRGVLARPIERLVVLDRLLFVREAGYHDAFAEEIFDPRVSPRSTAIVAGAGRDEW